LYKFSSNIKNSHPYQHREKKRELTRKNGYPVRDSINAQTAKDPRHIAHTPQRKETEDKTPDEYFNEIEHLPQ